MEIVPVPGAPALELPAARALVLADLHYGIEAELLRGGVWVPNRARERTARVVELLRRTGAERLLLMGDVKHQVPHSSHQERRDIADLFAATTRLAQVEVVPGNHDGMLDQFAPEAVVFHPSEGVVVGGVGLHHGHAWPSAEVMGCETVLMGHNHPALAFRDRLDRRHTEPCWVRAPMLPSERYATTPRTLVVLPAFGELAGRTVNREPFGGLGPLLRHGLADLPRARIETLEGLDFGELRHLTELRL